MIMEDSTQRQEDVLRKTIESERERFEAWTKTYLVDVLGYISPPAKEKIRGKKIGCGELVHLCKIGIIEKNAQIMALHEQLRKASEKISKMAQIDCFEGCSFSPSQKIKKRT